MTKVIDRNTVKMERLNPEYFPSGRSLRLDVYMLEGGERAYKIFIYDHSEGHSMEYGQYSRYSEAVSDYEDVLVTYF